LRALVLSIPDRPTCRDGHRKKQASAQPYSSSGKTAPGKPPRIVDKDGIETPLELAYDEARGKVYLFELWDFGTRERS
jgi:hypothetical protein